MNIEERCPAIQRLRNGKIAACEIPTTYSGRRAWVGVYPLHSLARSKQKGDYRIRVFEVDEKYLGNDNDVWDEVMIFRMDYCVFGKDNLLAKVEEFVDPCLLADPWISNYPVWNDQGPMTVIAGGRSDRSVEQRMVFRPNDDRQDS